MAEARSEVKEQRKARTEAWSGPVTGSTHSVVQAQADDRRQSQFGPGFQARSSRARNGAKRAAKQAAKRVAKRTAKRAVKQVAKRGAEESSSRKEAKQKQKGQQEVGSEESGVKRARQGEGGVEEN